MLNKTDNSKQKDLSAVELLKYLELSGDEAVVYLALLKQPSSHLELARSTGVNRTKVYRIADDLEKRSLIAKSTDDTGTLLTATDPCTLELAIIEKEALAKRQREAYARILPELELLKSKRFSGDELDFTVNTYEGVEGFKQMLWHELKANKEALIFGSGELEKLVPNIRWCEQHRAKTVAAGYRVREICNPDGKPDNFTKNKEFVEKFYDKRIIPAEILPLEHQTVIYNDTVAVYNWRGDHKVGYEVINKSYAAMWRSMFEHYWTLSI